jgi:hypothetical protein
VESGNVRMRFHFDSLTLLPGSYTIGATVRRAESADPLDWWFGRTTLHVASGPSLKGQFYMPYRFALSSEPLSNSRTRYTTVHRSL